MCVALVMPNRSPDHCLSLVYSSIVCGGRLLRNNFGERGYGLLGPNARDG